MTFRLFRSFHPASDSSFGLPKAGDRAPAARGPVRRRAGDQDFDGWLTLVALIFVFVVGVKVIEAFLT